MKWTKKVPRQWIDVIQSWWLSLPVVMCSTQVKGCGHSPVAGGSCSVCT